MRAPANCLLAGLLLATLGRPDAPVALPQAGVQAIAVALTGALDQEGFPAAEEWQAALPVAFDADWQGQNADPLRETEVRLLWSRETLFLRFRCRYRELTTFSDGQPDGRRYGLWERDVAEVFLQPDASDPRRYWEFEISPSGLWIDLDIALGEKAPLFDPRAVWRVNFFRVEGAAEPRFYSCWRPTNSPQPNFHVPEAFGKLSFR